MQIVNATAPADLPARLDAHGWALTTPIQLAPWIGATMRELDDLHASWSDLPPDAHLKDGGRYRFRRHGCYVLNTSSGELTQTPHRAHWQPVEYNALHGGIERWFEPIAPAVAQAPAWRSLLTHLGQALARDGTVPTWYIEAHQFRVDTQGGIGRPTPEGAHRDGVDYVAVILLERHGIKGGETRVFEAQGPHGVRFTLSEPWSLLLLDDTRVIHESTPIQPLGEHGWRDTLVLTFRQRGFQGPAQA
ncbi:hypothetical protein EIP75_08430 [Aquabacterium soli]|uniref:2OG-Fe dioxygenase family protein n=1 Tax=Aquabacterium soli TaxID=2493092 RepID=A0A426VDN4_9BURK|nr:2OG-Fe dioxygenase family protein [Aquabacterium soli]RRS04984.1 hypothetical protein EIP75_08430 [Aquabacterium soli]